MGLRRLKGILSTAMLYLSLVKSYFKEKDHLSISKLKLDASGGILA